ncbi:sodium-dependent neutral amino acid transporter B(0)AT3-like [Clytia hemisphaerica]|uniref:Transporter n=1 Tax=Clytia hemisphaerica TaxID=252671 RepID=A0A7M6DQG3_9CNID|eukprot:TCONS_00017686-protein
MSIYQNEDTSTTITKGDGKSFLLQNLKEKDVEQQNKVVAEETKDTTDTEEKRARWTNQREYLLSCIGFAVGLGNVWRFPWIVLRNGGGAFLIPYFTMLIIEGVPLLYLEISLGQIFQVGAAPLWIKLSRWSRGLGIASIVAGFLSSTFYRIVTGWVFYYFAVSFQNPLPWSYCPKDSNGTSTTQNKCEQLGSTEYYWYYETLQITDDFNNPGTFSWQLFLCLTASYVIVFFCVIKRIQSAGKVVYFTVIFPYLVLLILFVQGFMLEGYSEGLKLLFTPKWHRLTDLRVWKDAATQIFYSIGVGYGGMLAFSSYNQQKESIMKNTMIIAVVNSVTSLFGSIAMFSILGYRATKKSQRCFNEHSKNPINGTKPLSIDCSVNHFIENTGGGTGLAFIAFTEAIDLLPASNFFAIMFFLMLITLALDSLFGGLESIMTSIMDFKIFPNVKYVWKLIIYMSISYVASSVNCLGTGDYMVQLFNDFGIDLIILFVTFSQLVVVCYIYGFKRFSLKQKTVTGQDIPLFFQICWRFVSPIVIFVMIIMTLYQMEKNQFAVQRL